MTHERIKGAGHVFHCDLCPEVYEASEDGFEEAWAEAKAEGWETVRMKGEWVHTCPSCSED